MILPFGLIEVPRFHQAGALQLHGESEGMVVVQGTIILAEGKTCRAIDAKTLEPKWQRALPYQVGELVVAGSEIVCCGTPEYRKTTAGVYGLNLRTGAVQWSLPRKCLAGLLYGSPIAADAQRIYASLTPNGISAIDRKTHHILWTRTVAKDQDKGVEKLVSAEGTLLAYHDSSLTGLNATAGKPRWNYAKTYYFGTKQITATDGIVWTSGDARSAGVDLLTGKERWQSKSGCTEGSMLFAGRLVGLDHGQVFGVDPKNGHVVRRCSIGPENTSGGYTYVVPFGKDLLARGITRTVCLDTAGKEKWSISNDASVGIPLWYENGRFVCYDSHRLLAYVPGDEAPEPTDPAGRRALAAELTSRFSTLDDAGVHRLTALGADAFEPVFQAFVDAGNAYDKKEQRRESSRLYDLYHDLAKVMDATATSSNTDELLQRLSSLPAKASARPFILSTLARVGDENKTIPYFLKELNGSTPGFEMYESSTYVARAAIVRSSHPAAVAFLIDKLKDPKADSVLREEAYDHLAGTGEAGVKAVLAERNTRRLLPTLAERMVLDDPGLNERDRKPTMTLSVKADGKGRTWALASCGILGSHGDLWVLEKVGGKWTHPVFTGVSLDGISSWAKTTDPAPKAFGKSAKELAKGAWYPLLVDHLASLAKDTDGDGLTDLVEARLLTDPTKADSDGDGDRDEIDPWPTVANRPLKTDTEKVLAAVFEARFHFFKWPVAAQLTVPDDLPLFEMPSWPGPVLTLRASDRSFKTPLERCYQQGVAFVAFEMDKKGLGIHWNADRTEASLGISTYYGGLDGTGYEAVVRKFGNEWLVVSLDMAYQS